jgi:periplasmic protein TonB
MDLGTWERHKIDKVRVRRLAAGYVTGAVLLATVLGTVAMTAAKAYGLSEETIVEAALVANAKDEPVVEVKEEPAKRNHQKAKTLAPIVEPTKVTNTLVEKEPAARSTDNPYGAEDPYALLEAAREQTAEGARPKIQEAPKVVQKPQLAIQKTKDEPIRVTEDVTPPKSISMHAPSYPADAKAAGIEGVVVVQYVVTESGEVKDVQAVRGPPELVAVCVAAVQSWRFMPAMKDGQPVAVHRIARFPFRIKT